MLSFFVLTAAADDGRGTTRHWHHLQKLRQSKPAQQYDDDDSYTDTNSAPSAELWDFLGIRVWQKSDDIFHTQPNTPNRKRNQTIKVFVQHYLNELANLHFKEKLGNKNIALLIIDDGTDSPHLVNKLFISIGRFTDHSDPLTDFRKREPKVLSLTKQNIPLRYTSIYIDEDIYTQDLISILSTQTDQCNLPGICKIFINEINDPINDNFSLNWHHSEQGILQWLKHSNFERHLTPGKTKYRIFILTYRAMCLRCSTTFFLQKKMLEDLFAAPVEIISMSVQDYADKLGTVPQLLVFDNQNTQPYNNRNGNYLIRMLMEQEEQE